MNKALTIYLYVHSLSSIGLHTYYLYEKLKHNFILNSVPKAMSDSHFNNLMKIILR